MRTNSTLLHFIKSGVEEAPTLVFIPGLSGTTWQGRLDGLAGKCIFYMAWIINPGCVPLKSAR